MENAVRIRDKRNKNFLFFACISNKSITFAASFKAKR